MTTTSRFRARQALILSCLITGLCLTCPAVAANPGDTPAASQPGQAAPSPPGAQAGPGDPGIFKPALQGSWPARLPFWYRFAPPVRLTGAGPSDETAARARHLTVRQVELLREMRGLTNREILEMPESKLKRALHKAEHPKRAGFPDEAAAWRRESLVDEHGVVPDRAWLDAIDHVRRMEPPPNRRIWGHDEPLEGEKDAGIAADKWTWLGPGNIGGRLRSHIIHPTNHNLMWVGSISGGIWKSTNAGASWAPVNDFMANLAVTCMVMHPTDPNVLYAGTGEGFNNVDAIQGQGIFKSTDGGTTWTHLPSTLGQDWYYVNRLAFNSNGSLLLAATRSGLYWTNDGGAIWNKLFNNESLDVKFAPGSTLNAIASGRGFHAYADSSGNWWLGSGISYSSGQERVELAYAPSNPSIVYALVDINQGTFYRSNNGGATFTGVSGGYQILGSQGWYDNIIWVDPTNPNVVVCGGIDTWRSTDGGTTFTKISEWWRAPASAHADHHYLVHHPNFNGTTNKTVYCSNDGGIYRADDIYTVSGPSGWQELNNNLGVTQFYGIAGNASNGRFIGGTQDNGSICYTGSTEGWIFMSGGDGGYCAWDPTDPDTCYGEYVNLKIYRNQHAADGGSQDQAYPNSEYICGQFWDGSQWAWKSAPYLIQDAKDGNAEFIAPFVIDPNNANRLIGGGMSLWRTNDAKTPNSNSSGPSWQAIAAPAGQDSNAMITAIAIAKGNSDVVWYGTRGGYLFKTGNGTASNPSWTEVGQPLPARRTQRITIDPSNHNTAYATFGGFATDNVWKTTNGGSSWTNIHGSGATGLPAVPVRSLVIHPTNSQWLYVGTEVGIFASENGGSTWSSTNQGPTNCSVDELLFLDNSTLVAATHGRGLFKITVGGSGPVAGNYTIGGYLGVGTQSPARAVHIVGSNAVFRMDRNQDSAAFMLVRSDAGGNAQKTFVVGVNSSGSNQGEFVINDLGAAVSGSGSRRMTIDTWGATTFTGSVTAPNFYQSSTARLKEAIAPLADAVALVAALRGVTFDWRDSGERSLGFIAEEVLRVLPEVVQRGAGGSPLGLDYGKLTAVLVECLKQQHREIEAVSGEVGRLERLLAELEALKAKLPVRTPRAPHADPSAGLPAGGEK